MSDREANRQFGRNGRTGRGGGGGGDGRARSPRLSPGPHASHVRQRPAELLAQGESARRGPVPPPARASSASPALDTRHRSDSGAARPHTHGGSPHGQPWRRRNGSDSRSPSPAQPLPERTPLLVGTPVPPWLPADTKEPVTLDEDLRRFAEYIAPSAEEIGMRNDVVERLCALVHELWPRAHVDVFGSFATGLCLPMSDLDLVVHVDTAYQPLPVLENVLEKRFRCTGLEAIAKARVPLIKFRDAETSVSVDISFNADNGPRNCAIVRRLLVAHPEARPLILALKYILHSNWLSEVYYGGIGSYGLTLMVVSFIQMRKRARASLALGDLFLGFLQLYGFQFNYELTGISLRNGGSYFPKKRHNWFDPRKPFLLAIEDPDNPENDVGKGSFNILSVRMLFAQLFNVLTRTRGSISPLSTVVFVHSQLEQYRAHVRRTYSPATVPNLGDGDSPAPTSVAAAAAATASAPSSVQAPEEPVVVLVDDDSDDDCTLVG